MAIDYAVELRRILADKNLSQTELATLINTSQQNISAVVNGDTKNPHHTIVEYVTRNVVESTASNLKFIQRRADIILEIDALIGKTLSLQAATNILTTLILAKPLKVRTIEEIQMLIKEETDRLHSDYMKSHSS